jgi:hypothetical protein
MTEACDWSTRQPRVSDKDCIPKAACPVTSACRNARDPSIGVANGKITWSKHDVNVDRVAGLPPASMPAIPSALAGMFCLSASELVVPSEYCAK